MFEIGLTALMCFAAGVIAGAIIGATETENRIKRESAKKNHPAYQQYTSGEGYYEREDD